MQRNYCRLLNPGEFLILTSMLISHRFEIWAGDGEDLCAVRNVGLNKIICINEHSDSQRGIRTFTESEDGCEGKQLNQSFWTTKEPHGLFWGLTMKGPFVFSGSFKKNPLNYRFRHEYSILMHWSTATARQEQWKVKWLCPEWTA